MLNYSEEDIAGYNVGDIVRIGGKTFFLEQKSSRLIKVRRYYWFDKLASKVTKLLGGA